MSLLQSRRNRTSDFLDGNVCSIANFPAVSFLVERLMKNFVTLLTLATAMVVGLAPTVVVAVELDVFVGRPTTGSKTAFGFIDVDASAITLNQRVFESEMGEDPFEGVFLSAEPGFNHPANDAVLPAGVASLNAGDEIFVTALPLSVGAMSASRFFWDGLGSVNFTPAPNTSFSIDTGNMTDSIGTAGAGGGFDDHPFFVLDDGDGLAATFPTPGIYLASFQARVAELNPTDPLFLVMGTEGLITPDFLGISQQDFDVLSDDEIDELLEGVIETAVDYVQKNVVVPEPASWTLIAVACCSFAVAGRRRF